LFPFLLDEVLMLDRNNRLIASRNLGLAFVAIVGISTTSAGATMSSTGSAPAATSSKSGGASVGASYIAIAMTFLAATVFATWMGWVGYGWE
jgi:hypothetical protein